MVMMTSIWGIKTKQKIQQSTPRLAMFLLDIIKIILMLFSKMFFFHRFLKIRTRIFKLDVLKKVFYESKIGSR